jgi:hypothetical protein
LSGLKAAPPLASYLQQFRYGTLARSHLSAAGTQELQLQAPEFQEHMFAGYPMLTNAGLITCRTY